MQVGRLKKLDSDFTEAAVATTELMHSPVRSKGAGGKLYCFHLDLLYLAYRLKVLLILGEVLPPQLTFLEKSYQDPSRGVSLR